MRVCVGGGRGGGYSAYMYDYTFVVRVVMQRSWPTPDTRGGVGGSTTQRNERDITTIGELVETKISTDRSK